MYYIYGKIKNVHSDFFACIPINKKYENIVFGTHVPLLLNLYHLFYNPIKLGDILKFSNHQYLEIFCKTCQ